MKRLEYGGQLYRIIDQYEIDKSSREVTYSSTKIDFTGKTLVDLPLKYQECHIVEVDDEDNILNIDFTGYVNTTKLPNMKNEDEERELEIELLSPMALATRRTITAIGTFQLKSLLTDIILTPLFNDGFELVEFNIEDTELSVNYLIETVESSLNKLSNKYNIWWYIDENKKIYINSIDYLLAKTPKITYDNNNKLNGLIDITPNIDATEYCNVVDFTNVRTWQYSARGHIVHTIYDPYGEIEGQEEFDVVKDSLFDEEEININQEIVFKHPIDITIDNIKKSVKENEFREEYDDYKNFAFYMDLTYEDNSYGTAFIRVQNTMLQLSSNVSITENDTSNKDFQFKRDGFFNNLLTGFTYNGSKKIKSIELVFSNSALMWTRLKVNDLKQINKAKGKISTSGIIEKIIDMNEQWKTIKELQEMANSYIKSRSNQVDKINLVLDELHDLKNGDIIEINKNGFLINGKYIITDIRETYKNDIDKEYRLELRNSDYFESYVDLFRYNESEEQQDKIYSLTTIDYDNGTIKEVHEVV